MGAFALNIRPEARLSLREVNLLLQEQQTPLDRLVSASYNPIVQTVMVVGGSFLIARAVLNANNRWWFAFAGILLVAPLFIRNQYIDTYRERRRNEMSGRIAVAERVNDIFLDVPDDMEPPGGDPYYLNWS